MKVFKPVYRPVLALVLVCLLTFTTACSSSTTATKPQLPPAGSTSSTLQTLQTGNTPAGQSFGDWVLKTASGLISDAYVRDNDKLGVVITPEVKPTEVKDLAKSLVQGFRRNFPNQDLTVLMYAPDKQLILTANYDTQSQQVKYE